MQLNELKKLYFSKTITSQEIKDCCLCGEIIKPDYYYKEMNKKTAHSVCVEPAYLDTKIRATRRAIRKQDNI